MFSITTKHFNVGKAIADGVRHPLLYNSFAIAVVFCDINKNNEYC
jgi:hypothetical protein